MATPPITMSRGVALDAGVVMALLARDLRRFLRQRSRIVGSLAQPLILWMVLGTGLGSSFRVPGIDEVRYLGYFFPGVLVLTVLFTAIFSTISVIEDRHHGFLQAVLVSPASRGALVLGKTAGGVSVAMLQAALLCALSPLAGFPIGSVSWPLLACMLILAAVGFTALGFAVAWWIDSTQGYHALMSVALIPLWVLSGAMFPASPDGGGWMSVLMRFDPMTYVVTGVRRALHGGVLHPALNPVATTTAAELAIVGLFSAASVVLAIALCRRRA